MNDARSAATVADLMRFTWTFLPTVTIDLTGGGARDMPDVLGGNRPVFRSIRRSAEVEEDNRSPWMTVKSPMPITSLGRGMAALLALVAILGATHPAAGKQTDVRWLLLVDDLHISFVETGRLRDLLKAIATDLVHDSDTVAIRATGPSGLTSPGALDREWLSRRAKGATGNAMKLRDVAELLQQGGRTSGEVPLRERRAQDATLELLSTAEEHPDARSVLVFVSSGWPLGPESIGTEAVIARASSMKIPIVTIDPRHDGGQDSRPLYTPAELALADAGHASLQAMADRSGGIALLYVRNRTYELKRVSEFVRR